MSGTVLITGRTISASFDGMVEASISFQGTGALTESTVA
jgi:predicted secreted protein